MARRVLTKPKKAKKVRNSKIGDTAFMGPEPDKGSDLTDRISLQKAYNWYNYFYGAKDAKDFILVYMAKNGMKDHEAFANITDARFGFVSHTVAWIARLKDRGCKLPRDAEEYFERKLEDYRTPFVYNSFMRDDDEQPPAPMPVTIAAITAELQANIDSEDFDSSIYDRISRMNLTDTRKLIAWIAAFKTDEEMVKYYLKEVEYVARRRLAKLTSQPAPKEEPQNAEAAEGAEEITVVAPRRQRRRRIVPPERQTRHVKFVETVDEFGIKSIEPKMLIGANKTWFYNARTRQIAFFESKTPMGLKGLQLTGEDTTGKLKRLRKPKEFFEEFTKCTPVRRTRLFEALTTEEYDFPGRINKNMVFLSKT